MRYSRFTLSCFALSMALLAVGGRAAAQETSVPVETTVRRGLAYLRDVGQQPDGAFSPRAGSGITALAVTAALRSGVPMDDPLVERGLAAMERFVKPDGGVYGSDRLRNYETCVAILCFSEANKDGRYDEILKSAERYVRGLQVGAAGDVDKQDEWYGGVGYGGPERPDLSNTGYLVDALKAMDAGPDDPAIARALVFVSRCQNLEGRWNDTKFGGLVNDGGFYYTIPTENVDPSTSERYTADGGLRSYGSMSYSGFKSLVYAGLTKDDPRVTAVLGWIGDNYSVTENPGMGNAGLYYYYNSFASALDASGLDEVETDGTSRDWRSDLVTQLQRSQKSNGSWVNSNRQWFENDPNLCTAFALMALAHCQETADEGP